ncbi:MAG: GGDEF domain-containing protein [Candidatus Brocadiaceae bacterium]|nr:GGDEF domain-containing protein [Candidatus Brocadiaceae bacterium]
MINDEILKKILHSQAITTLPSVATKVISLSSKEEISIKEIADLISKDVSLSAKVLKIANSAFYSFPVKISTISQAVSRIGANAIRSLVLSFSFLSMQANNKITVFCYKKFLEKSLAAAVAAKLIMREVDKTDPEEIFVSALLQDIGEVILVNTFPEQYEQVLKHLSNNKDDIRVLEQQFIGADHTLVGYEVAKDWRFPDEISMPIRYHHSPEKYDGKDKKLQLMNTVVHLSGFVAETLYPDNLRFAPIYHKNFCEKAKSMAGLQEESIEKILKQVHTEIEQTANFLDFKITAPEPIENVLLEANAALSAINMTYEQINNEHVAAQERLHKLTKELEEKNQLLEQLANIDGMTGVYNHRFLQNFLAKEVKRASRNRNPISLILFDIDYFKLFNDKYGHQIGDFILKELCQLVKKFLREYDVIARYGGEEFAIVLIETPKTKALAMAERICSKIKKSIFTIHNNKLFVTASFGVAEIIPCLDNYKKEDLINFADQALLESKIQGRNRVTLYGKVTN